MWKMPLCMFILNVIYHNNNRILKYISWAITVIILLAVDILLTIFIPNIYK